MEKKNFFDTNKENVDNSRSYDLDISKYTTINSEYMAAKIVFKYILIGVLWIILSDKILMYLVSNIEMYQQIQTYKGWFYILITAIILFLMIKRNLEKLKDMSIELYKKYQELNLVYEELLATEEDLKEHVEELKISQAKHVENEEKIYNLAYYDSLTGLPNRSMLQKVLNSKLKHAENSSSKIGLLYFDLDNFKIVNDTLGHTYGDMLLRMVADELAKYKKEGEILARIGGDEFVFIVSNFKDSNELETLASKIIMALGKPWVIDAHEFYISTSIGIAIFPEHGKTYNILLKNADTAMHNAKLKGKSCYEVFDFQMHDNILEYIDMEKSIRYAIKNQEFTLYYQPQIDLKSGKVIGLEALIRWIHPKKGIIPPNKFIPIAEKTGLIREIGKWVIYEACRQNKEWIEKGYKPIKISINLSAIQLKQKNLIEDIKNIIEETGVDSNYIEFEITENAAIKDLEKTIGILKELKQMNFQIALDDFGTGYSSLNYLKMLPIDYIKLDKFFISNVTIDSKEQAITKFLIKLAKEMAIKIIAEGIETNDQYDYLKKHNCDIGQGYLFGKPISANEIEEILKDLNEK